jgi:hypothetical protein
MMDGYAALDGMKTGRGKGSTRRKPAPVPLCPPQIPHNLTWAEPGPPRWEGGDLPPELWYGQSFLSYSKRMRTWRPQTGHYLLFSKQCMITLLTCLDDHCPHNRRYESLKSYSDYFLHSVI